MGLKARILSRQDTKQAERPMEPIADKLSDYREMLAGRTGSSSSAEEAIGRLHKTPDDVKLVSKLLFDSDFEVRLSAAWAINEVAQRRIDLTPIIRSLGTALYDDDPDIRMNVICALMSAQENRARIAPAIDAIRASVFDVDENIGVHALAILWTAAREGDPKAANQVLGLVFRSLRDGKAEVSDESGLSDGAVGLLYDMLKIVDD